MKSQLVISVHNIQAWVCWCAWLALPGVVIHSMDSRILWGCEQVIPPEELKWQRLVVAFACGLQLTVGLWIKLCKQQRPLLAEVKIRVGRYKLSVRAGADLPLRQPALQSKARWYQAQPVPDEDARIKAWSIRGS